MGVGVCLDSVIDRVPLRPKHDMHLEVSAAWVGELASTTTTRTAVMCAGAELSAVLPLQGKFLQQGNSFTVSTNC